MKHISIITIPTIIIVLLYGVQIFLSHRLSTEGIALTEMSEEITTLTHENELLAHQIASASSHLTVSTRAAGFGFTSAEITYIEQPPMALFTE